MSLQSITIERRQPLFDRTWVKIPGGENNTLLPPITVAEAKAGLNGTEERVNTLTFGYKERRGILPYYQKHLSLDFLTYAVVGTDGKTIGQPDSLPVDDIQQGIRDISEAKY